MPQVEVKPVESSRDFDEFIQLPYRLHAADPNWVPPLLADQKKTLARSYPFFLRGDGRLLLARRGGKVVGRISAHVSYAHLEKHKDGRGFFGWFECENDPNTSEALFGAAMDWLLSLEGERLSHIRGPLNWDMNGECLGVLLPEVSEPGLPVVLMPHNPAYYPKLIEAAGFEKAMDLFAWQATAEQDGEKTLSMLGRISDAAKRRLPGVSLRPLDIKARYREDMEIVRSLFNQAWAENWAATDLTHSEMAVIANGLKPVVRTELTCVASVDGEPAGCLVCVPDINPLLKKLGGKLLPFGWLTMLLGLKKLTGFRTMLMGVATQYRGRGLEAMMIEDVVRRGIGVGFRTAELSWVLETNTAMNSIAGKIGRHYRTYRLYEREL